tara:strand:- start:51 stop:845 length:795 start_codon:yes stop_codon:yes gene_type:complete
MTGIVKTDQIQGAQGTTVTVPTGHTLTTDLTSASLSTTSSTATIAEFKKSGTTIGHIGVHDNDGFFFTRGATQQGIVLKNSALMPCNTDGSNSDNDQDLGISSVRWKDLYLSGGLRVGGTGSANYLDDYEEGSWTPNCATAGVSGSYSVQLGRYIKVGNLVQCIFNLTTSAAYTGSTSQVFKIGGLPFANKYYDGSLYAGGNIGYYFNINTVDTCKQIVYQIPSGSATSFELKGTGDAQGEISIIVSNMDNYSTIRGQLVYHTA